MLTNIMVAAYPVQLTDQVTDPEWDDFVRQTPGGSYLQTSLWGQVEELRGRRVMRFIVRQGGGIVAGAQLAIQRLPFGVNIGYVHRGPLMRSDDPQLNPIVEQALSHLTRACRLQYVVLQPAHQSETIEERLPEWKFRPCSIGAGLTTAILMDLTPDLDSILAQMRASTRRSFHKGLRAGVSVRMGDAADLATFHRLHVGTAQRQTFLPLPEAYFAHMWRVLHPLGHLQLFLTKYNHEPVSGMLVICFGDTAHAEYFGWSGRWQKCRPNEVLCWSMIQWAKSQGYHYFNMGWINPQVAQTIESGGKLSESLNHTPASFKLGFSKQIFRFPGSYDRVYSPITGWACRLIVPKFANSSSLRNVMARIL